MLTIYIVVLQSERILELSSFELPMENDWENLTDPILLSVFSYLNYHELNNASKSCKVTIYYLKVLLNLFELICIFVRL